jgi:hypothetical protein
MDMPQTEAYEVTFLGKWNQLGASIRLQGVVDLLASREMRSAQWRERERQRTGAEIKLNCGF